MAGPDGKVWAAAMGPGSSAAVEPLKSLADVWRVGEEGALGAYDLPGWSAALRAVIEASEADLVLGGASVRGREMFAFLSASAGWPLAPECARIEREEGGFLGVRPVLGGRALKELRTEGRPFLVTVRPNTFSIDAAPHDRAGEIGPLQAPPDVPGSGRVTYGERETMGGSRPGLTEAKIVVAGGRGLKDPSNFRLIEDLADAMGAAVGASRAVVDAGWRDISEQVGKSGRTVSPRLYIAAGISGAIHHLMGMDTAKIVVAIDKDPTAPIFEAADFGIVGDAEAILPALTDAVKAGS
jgi:electron transfer flavoprotein alpha subunit